MSSLHGIVLKTARAHEHLAVLEAKVDSYIADRGIVGEFEPDTSEYVFRVSGEPPPLDWGILVGEFAHNLRSSLDNLLWALIEARGRRPSPANQFPIFESPTVKKRKGCEVVDAPTQTRIAEMTQGVRKDDRTFIEEAQPYHEGPYAARDPLALLGHLNNLDKHRFIHPAVAALALRRYGEAPLPFFPGVNVFMKRGIPAGNPLPIADFPWPTRRRDISKTLSFTFNPPSDDRTEILRAQIVTSGSHPEMEVDPGAPFHVSLSDRSRPVLIADLYRIYRRVVEIRDRFAGVIG